MSLKEDLKKTLVASAKAKDQVRLDTIRAIQSAVRYKEIEKRSELMDPEIVSVIGSLCKQRRDSIEQFQKGGRQDLVDKESRELGILQEFLPEPLSQEEIEKVIRKVIGETGAAGIKDMGNVMKVAVKELAGKADGKLVSDLVRSLLTK